MIVSLYAPQVSMRLRYIVAHLFTDLLGVVVELTTDQSHFQAVTGIAVNYSKQPIRQVEVHLYPAPILFESGVQEQELQGGLLDGTPYCFATSSACDLPFDPLAAAFFILSRYEEYLPHEKDQHGRYPAASSWLVRTGAIDRPVLWEWAKLLRSAIKKKYPNWEPPQQHRQYQFLPTYDIDIPWAYRHRGLRGWGRTALDVLGMKLDHLQARTKAWFNHRQDAYFTFLQLEQLHRKTGIRPTIFWLVADRALFDVNPKPSLSAFQTLVRQVAQWSETGLHPSYQRGQQASGITLEQKRLERILQKPIQQSRQHFLRLSLPHTYQQLLAAGMEADYSMGYAEQPGFRAGTSEPFWWYDLTTEEITSLRIYPFVAMDVTLKQYQELGPTEAQAYLQEIQAYCKGDSSFAPLFGWDREWWLVYQSLF